MSISYHEQFHGRQPKKNSTGVFSNSKATAGGQLPAQRSTVVVKQPLRSNTFTLPTKRDKTKFKVPQITQPQNGSRRQATNKPAVVKSPPPAEPKRPVPMRKTVVTQSTNNRQNLLRKPVRFANNYNYSSSPPAYYPKSAPLADPLPQDHLERSRRMHITNDNHHRRDSPAYTYTDYQTVSNNMPTTSYLTALPPISQSTNPTAPTVVIHPKETRHSDTPTVIIHTKENSHSRSPTVIRTLSTAPPYHSSAPVMILPSSNAPTSTMFLPNSTFPTYPQTSTMFLPNSTLPTYAPNSTMFLPTTTGVTQPPAQTYFLQPQATSTYLSQPFFYPIPLSRPNPPPMPPPAPPPPPPQQTIISQSSSSSVSAPTTVTTENKTEGSHATIVVQPNSINNKKNVTIQLKMLDEDYPSQRVVRVVRDSPYRELDDVYYIDSEPQRVVYEQPRRRTAIVRRPTPVNEYVYVDESPSTMARRHPHRSEVVYIDNDQPVEYAEEIVYDDDIDYIYEDDPRYHRRSYTTSRQRPSLTNIVYQ